LTPTFTIIKLVHISSSQSSLSSTKLDIIATPHINHEPTNICCGKKNKNNNKKLKYVVLDQFLETTILNCFHYSFHPIRPNSAFLDMRFCGNKLGFGVIQTHCFVCD
jgi:hypothetical protein